MPMRVLVGHDIDVTSPVFEDAEEGPASADDVEVTVTDAFGEALDAPTATAVPDVTGVYSAPLTAADHTGDLNTLTLVWTGTVDGKARRYTQTVEVVGGHFVSLSELRQAPGQTIHDIGAVRAARSEFEDLAERYRGFAMVPRLSVVRVPYTQLRSGRLLLEQPEIRVLRSVTVDGTAVDLDDVTLDAGGVLALPSQPTAGDVVVAVEHGTDTPPEAARRGCREFVGSALGAARGGAPDNVLTWGDGSGATFRSSTADWAAGRPTGWMRADDALNEIPDRRLPGIA